eukprot:scaffold7775_cov61-Cyclotella_meneghiniana.AAC.1
MDLQLKRDMAKSICNTGEVRHIEKMLNLLERQNDRIDEDLDDVRVNSLIDQMLAFACQRPKPVGPNVNAEQTSEDGQWPAKR